MSNAKKTVQLNNILKDNPEWTQYENLVKVYTWYRTILKSLENGNGDITKPYSLRFIHVSIYSALESDLENLLKSNLGQTDNMFSNHIINNRKQHRGLKLGQIKESVISSFFNPNFKEIKKDKERNKKLKEFKQLDDNVDTTLYSNAINDRHNISHKTQEVNIQEFELNWFLFNSFNILHNIDIFINQMKELQK